MRDSSAEQWKQVKVSQRNAKESVEQNTSKSLIVLKINLFTDKIYSKKQLPTKQNVTKMVFYTSIVFLVGNIMGPAVYFLVFVFGLKLKNSLLIISLLSNTLQFSSNDLNMFVFYSFNKKYRSRARKIIYFFKFIIILIK